jgi:hypothetical protein
MSPVDCSVAIPPWGIPISVGNAQSPFRRATWISALGHFETMNEGRLSGTRFAISNDGNVWRELPQASRVEPRLSVTATG